MLPNGTLDYTKVPELISQKTKLVAITAISNVTGHEVDSAYIETYTHAVGAALLIDACQSVARRTIQVHEHNIDFLVFSGHKMGGPSGIGVLFVKHAFHEAFKPLYGGGGAVVSVDHEVVWRDVPYRYEVGTPAIANVMGLGAAISYVKALDKAATQEHEAHLCRLLIEGLQTLNRVKIMGCHTELMQKGHMVSFIVDGIHAYDVAECFNTKGIAVRAGHHCAQPLHRLLHIPASVRVSFYIYNTPDDVEKILEALKLLLKINT